MVDADASQIRTVLAQIAQYADGGSLEDYIELFAEDAEWELQGRQKIKGHDAILAAAQQRRADKVTGPRSNTRHVVSTSIVAVQDAHAQARSVFQFFESVNTSPTLTAIGVYRDTFEKVSGAWKLKTRLIEWDNG